MELWIHEYSCPNTNWKCNIGDLSTLLNDCFVACTVYIFSRDVLPRFPPMSLVTDVLVLCDLDFVFWYIRINIVCGAAYGSKFSYFPWIYPITES